MSSFTANMDLHSAVVYCRKDRLHPVKIGIENKAVIARCKKCGTAAEIEIKAHRSEASLAEALAPATVTVCPDCDHEVPPDHVHSVHHCDRTQY